MMSSDGHTEAVLGSNSGRPFSMLPLSGACDDVTPLTDLLQSSHNATQQVLDELKILEQPNVAVENLAITKLVKCFRYLDHEQKEHFVMRLVIDFADMQAAQQVELLRLALRVADLIKHEKNPTAGAPKVSPFFKNMMKITAELGISPSKALSSEASKALGVQAAYTLLELGLWKLIVIASELLLSLTFEERQQFQEEVVGNFRLEKASQCVMQRLLKTGGHMDKCALAVEFLKKWGLVCCIVPFVELVLPFLGPHLSHASLVTWLRCDAVLWIIAIIAAWVFKVSAEALALEMFEQYTQAEHVPDTCSNATWKWTRELRLQITCASAAVCTLLALIAGAIGGIIAAGELVIGLFIVWRGSILLWLLCVVFDVLRVGFTAGFVYAVCVPAHDVWALYHVHEGESDGLRALQDVNYGSVAGA